MKRRSFIAITSISILSGCLDDGNERSNDDRMENNEGNDRTDNLQERIEIATEYGFGIVDFNDCTDDNSDGLNAYNNEEYSSAITHYSRAENHLIDAKEHFNECVRMATSIDHDEAIEAADTAHEVTTLRQSAIQSKIAASEAALDGHISSANDNVNEANELETEAARMNLRDGPTFRAILDLERPTP